MRVMAEVSRTAALAAAARNCWGADPQGSRTAPFTIEGRAGAWQRSFSTIGTKMDTRLAGCTTD